MGFYIVLFFIIYILVYGAAALTFVPFDKFEKGGTFIFLSPLPTLPIIFFVLYFARRANRTFHALGLILGHYLFTLLLILKTLVSPIEWNFVLMTVNQNSTRATLTVSWYLFGQLVLWIVFLAYALSPKAHKF